MPLYTYRCKSCEHQFDIRQKYTDDPLTECPECEVGEIRKVINQVGVVFKGCGFYVNDAKGKNSAAPSTNGKTESSESLDSDSTESKGTEKTSDGSKSESKSKPKETASAAKD